MKERHLLSVESLKEMGEINMTGKLEFDLPFLELCEEFNSDAKLETLPLVELIRTLQKVRKERETKDTDELFNEQRTLEDTIGTKLGLIPNQVFISFMEKICEESKALEERIMSKVRNHRHDTSKVFTGRAEY